MADDKFGRQGLSRDAEAARVLNYTKPVPGGTIDWGTPTITTIQPDDAANAGSSTNPARSDHKHAIVAASAGTIQPDDSAAEGSATSFARSDHRHANVTAAPGANSVNLSASAEGSATSFARSDHTHQLDQGIAPTWTNDHIFQAGLTTRHIMPQATDTYDLGSSTKLWRKGWLSEMDAILFAQNTITLLGGWFLISKGEGALPFDVVAADTVINFGAGASIAQNDFVLFRAAGKVEYMQIGTNYSGNSWNVTRNLDGSGANDWAGGSPYVNLGYNGTGRIELNAYDTPRIQILSQGATYNAQTEVIRLGDLNGNWGYSVATYGIALGEYAASKANMTWDATNGLRLRTYTDTVIQLDNAGNADITGKLRMPGTSSAIAIGSTPPTAANAGTGVWIDRTGLYGILSNTYQVKIDATTGKLVAGSGYVSIAADGISLSGASRASVTDVQWTGAGNDYVVKMFGRRNGNTDVEYGSFSVQCIGDAQSFTGTDSLWLYMQGGNATNDPKLTLYSHGVERLSITPLAAIFAVDVYSVAWTDYSASSTITGWSSFTTKKIMYKKVGRRVDVFFSIRGTSDSTAVSFTLPYAMNNDGMTLIGPIYCVDNNAQQSAPGTFSLGAGGSTVSCYKTWTVSGNWTNTSTKEVVGSFSYETS
jgi:hypothetical protein